MGGRHEVGPDEPRRNRGKNRRTLQESPGYCQQRQAFQVALSSVSVGAETINTASRKCSASRRDGILRQKGPTNAGTLRRVPRRK